MPEVNIEFLPILVGGLLPMVIGMIWYSPMLFGNMWMKASGRTMKDMQGQPVAEYLFTTAGALIMSFVLFHFFNYAGVSDNAEALQFALWVWVGFAVPFVLAQHVFNGQKWKVFFIYEGYQLLNLVVISLAFANL